MVYPFIFILGISQVLPRDYIKQVDIELILREMAEQVAIRLRRAHKKCCTVYISIGFPRNEMTYPGSDEGRAD